MKKLLAIITVCLASFAFVACSPVEDRSLELVTDARRFVGVQELPVNIDLYFKAQSWSQQLARDQYLHHSRLSDGIGYSWISLGENIGYGGSIRQIHDAFLRSPPHRDNILNPKWNRIGIGVTQDANGRYWVVQEFMQERL